MKLMSLWLVPGRLSLTTSNLLPLNRVRHCLRREANISLILSICLSKSLQYTYFKQGSRNRHRRMQIPCKRLGNITHSALAQKRYMQHLYLLSLSSWLLFNYMNSFHPYRLRGVTLEIWPRPNKDLSRMPHIEQNDGDEDRKSLEGIKVRFGVVDRAV